jgi:hypothetical protein
MMTSGGTMARRGVRSFIGVLALAGGLSGCAAVRSNLGTTDSSCFLALPTAAQAVGDHGRFVGIHLYVLAQFSKLAPNLVDTLSDAHVSGATHVCVAAYEGTFTASGVMKPLGQPNGRLAVVVVDASNQKLLATVIVKRPPLHFGHPHMG